MITKLFKLLIINKKRSDALSDLFVKINDFFILIYKISLDLQVAGILYHQALQ